MIRYILEIMRGNRLMDVVEEDVKQMLDLARTLFEVSSEAALRGKPIDFDIYAKDRQINLLVINTRKRIVEHLSVSTVQNPVGELICLILINNIERIGDHAKNLFGIYRELDGPVEESPYHGQIYQMLDMVKDYFDKVPAALFEDDDAVAREIMEGHLELVKIYNQLLTSLLRDKEISARQAVALAEIIRALKRASSHLKTLASSAVNPFMLLGYMQMPVVEIKEGKEQKANEK